MSRACWKDPLIRLQLGPDFVTHVNSDKFGSSKRIRVAVLLGKANLVLEGVVAPGTSCLVFPLALLPLHPGGEFCGCLLGFGSLPNNFAGGGVPFTLAALLDARFPRVRLDLVESCPIKTVLTFFFCCAIATHLRPLVTTHFNNYNLLTSISSLAV